MSPAQEILETTRRRIGGWGRLHDLRVYMQCVVEPEVRRSTGFVDAINEVRVEDPDFWKDDPITQDLFADHELLTTALNEARTHLEEHGAS